ncbi:MAG TPA: alpha-amylase family glycosyl hydrolase [Ignavibacteriaceae bacterium]|nr:alpha-amylase family glycosyl hydrolase [Ignavibacteriaceae bacterium]
MKIKLFILILTAFVQSSFSQIITTTPQYPTENDSIVVFFDATQMGAAELLNYSGTVYAHTGVYTNKNSSTWQHVIGTWANNSTQPSLQRLGTNSYKLTIGYPRKLYNVADISEHITTLNFVFRSSDGSKQTRPDIIFNLYEKGSYSLLLDHPSVSNPYNDPARSPYFINQAGDVNIIAKAAALGTTSSTITLYVNGIQKSQVSGDSLNFNFVAADYSTGLNQVAIVGNDVTNLTDTLRLAIMINPAIVNSPLPAGNELGINYQTDPTKVTLALFAPLKSFAYVIGDFNDWEVNPLYFMNRDSVSADSVVWWITINGLTSQQEYAFQYLVDGNLRIADPFTHKVLDPWNDQYINSSPTGNVVYPNLISYPTGKTSEIVSTFQTGLPAYNWQVTNFTKPDKDKLVIYELLVRDFVSTHWFKTIEDTLSYLKTLGINAVEFMPVMEFEGNESWGYNPSFHLALDKYYGTPDAFKSLIDKAHSMGIAVILDVVLNHTMGQSPFARLYWNADSSKPARDNPWLNADPKHDYNVGNDFNHESNQTKYFVDRVTSYWIQKYHIDGFRFDLSKGFTQKNTLGDVAAWGHYDQSRIDILERIGNKIWQIDPASILILEHFADNNEEIVLSNFGFLSWGNMNYNYNEATMGYTANSNLSNAYYIKRGWPKSSLVAFMESHDEERLMYKNEQYGNSLGNYNIKDVRVGLNRIKEASAFFFLIPGPKMVWQFGELGYDYSIDFNGRVGNKPIRWDFRDDPARYKLYKTMAALIKLRENYLIFSDTAILDVTGAIKRITFSDTNMKVNIIGNFGVAATNVPGNFAQTGMWYDYFSGSGTNVSNTTQSVSLEPGEFHIYTTVQLPTPESELLTDIKLDGNTTVSDYKLNQNYPNPFNPSTIIKYQIPNSGNVTLKIYDVLGREVKTLIEEYKQRGAYQVSFNAANLASGIYIYAIRVNGFVSARKMILMK